MRSRGLVVAIAVVLAVLAAVGVIVYTNQVKNSATTEDTVAVIVSDQDIAASTELDPLLSQGGVFKQIRVPKDALVAGAVVNLDQLQGKVTSAPILANEQIPASRLGEGTSNLLGISAGHMALSMELDAPPGGNGHVQQGDAVSVFVTFAKGTPIQYKALKDMISKQALAQFLQAVLAAGGTTPTGVNNIGFVLMPFEYTFQLIRSVKVLDIDNPTVDETTGQSSGGTIVLALDLLPDDARSIVFSNNFGSLWLGLLPPDNKDGYPIQGTIGPDFSQVIGVGAK
jgi:Flp pilus assembly protein CpaB